MPQGRGHGAVQSARALAAAENKQRCPRRIKPQPRAALGRAHALPQRRANRRAGDQCAGAPIGRVVSLVNYGGGDILEIAPSGGGETLLLPFTKRVAPTIDFDAGRIVIEPPIEVDVEGEDED